MNGTRRLRAVAMMLALLVATPACSVLYGITRRTDLSEPPSFACVEKAIRSVDEIEDVQYVVEEGGRPLTLSGIGPPVGLHYFSYTSGRAAATLLIRVDSEGNVEFDQSFTSRNRLPQEEIDAARSLMVRVEAAIETQCGVPGLTERMTEWRSR